MNVLALFGGALVCRRALLDRHARVYCVDDDPWALRTALLNYPRELLGVAQRDLLKADPEEVIRYLGITAGKIDLILSTPCCQPWSPSGGKYKWDVSRRKTLHAVLPYVQVMRPKCVVLENVPTLAERLPGSLWLADLRAELHALGYETVVWRLLSADFGSPQLRKRLVVVAYLAGARPPLEPVPTHAAHPKGEQHPWRTLKDAIGHLTEEQAQARGLMPMSPEWAAKIAGVKPGEVLYPNGRRRLFFNRPCATLVTTPAVKKMPLLVHPDNDRFLSVTEYDLIQGSFPTKFPAGMHWYRKYLAIGNGLPPEILGPVLGNIEAISGSTSRRSQSGYARTLKGRNREQCWPTDPRFITAVKRHVPISVDVCATAENTVCAEFISPEMDTLETPWWGFGYMNPPFDSIETFLDKAENECRRGIPSLSLLPARTGRPWFQRLFDPDCPHQVAFLKHRLRFVGAKSDAPFDCIAVLMVPDGHPRAAEFRDGFWRAMKEFNAPRERSRKRKQKEMPTMEQSPVLVVEKTNNKKVGPVAATYASQASCPCTCPLLKGNGCYAEVGKCSLTTNRVNASPVKDPCAIARIEAEMIDKVANPLGLRVHTVGDCQTPEAARIVGEAMVRYQVRTGGRAWTYTHGWKSVAPESWRNANVLASCELLSEVRNARERGYATAITLDSFESKNAFDKDGIKIVPCPEQTVGKTCVECRMCMDVERLKRAGITIGFAAHGNKAKAVKAVVKDGLMRWGAIGFEDWCA